ncbi:MAG: hypothetical protein A2498_01265 [Lentisphaerae bacterium RIFOXYC12_FULL_60_16]|nr:MAG: hypothetical protein A2498_01265 [Lentisphaerae bacterium RIFOXYC12_FULL_60_16]OGV85035.1 MAG: hypothetical protein A2340_10040 [Lentisphaerae bacterium RIFOXYB12_FULL_60_10]
MKRWYQTGGGLTVLVVGGLMVLVTGCRSIYPPSNIKPVDRVMTVTGYCDCRICCSWTRNWYGRAVFAYGPMKGKPKQVGVTASGTRARKGTIAADTSRYPFGTIMYIPGYGYGRVEDRGGAIKGEHIDLFYHSHQQALRSSKRKITVQVWLPKRGK